MNQKNDGPKETSEEFKERLHRKYGVGLGERKLLYYDAEATKEFEEVRRKEKENLFGLSQE
jgi:hypothetical protein